MGPPASHPGLPYAHKCSLVVFFFFSRCAQLHCSACCMPGTLIGVSGSARTFWTACVLTASGFCLGRLSVEEQHMSLERHRTSGEQGQ